MKTRFAALTISALSLLGLLAVPAAQASGQFCYDVQVNANGSSVVSQTGCQDLP